VGTLSRRKGANAEREVIRLACAAGLEAERTWHTAQSPHAAERCCDVRIAGRPCQVKVAADGYKKLYDSLEAVEFLFVRADHREWLAIVRAGELMKLLKDEK
jgi:hypothetical protein